MKSIVGTLQEEIKLAQVRAAECTVLENLRNMGLIEPEINPIEELLGRCLSVIKKIEAECTTEQEGLDVLVADIKSAMANL